MSLFSKPKVVIWPKDDSLEIYLDQNENNTLSFETDLWQAQNDDSLKNLATFFQKNKITEAYVLLNDTYVATKTFIYDSVVTQLDPNEVITLAKDSVDFKISPESVTFDLEADKERTLVITRIFNQEKFQVLSSNLQKLGIKVLDYESVSSSIAKLFFKIDPNQYFFFYPQNQHDYIALLCNQGRVYLTSTIKKTLPELKKLLNYAQAYFGNKDPLQYLPGENYTETDICTRFNKASNIPLPVLSFFVANLKAAAAIIKTESAPVTDSNPPPIKMENNKKNLLPIIAVFIITAIVASVIVWFILNQNKNTEIATPGSETPESTVTTVPLPTEAPTPTPAPLEKTIKIQVLNATDINGQAATIKAKLTKLGFESVATGNSKESATENSIQIKKTLSADYFLQNIPEFATATVTELAATSTYDAVFVIGVDLGVSTKSSVTPTGKTAVTPTVKLSPTVND